MIDRSRVSVVRGGDWSGWSVNVGGMVVAICGDNKARADAVARDIRAGSPVIAYRRPTEKYR